jgi:hypothetical protein
LIHVCCAVAIGEKQAEILYIYEGIENVHMNGRYNKIKGGIQARYIGYLAGKVGVVLQAHHTRSLYNLGIVPNASKCIM